MMCGSGRWLRTRGVKQSQSASRVASAAPASRVESKRQPSLKRIQNHPRAHSIRTSRSVPNLGIVARPIRAIRSARASSSVLLRLAGERIPPSRARRRPVASSPVSIPRAHLGQQPILRQQLRDIRRQHHVSAVARARRRLVSLATFVSSRLVSIVSRVARRRRRRRARRRTCTRTRRRSIFRCTESAASRARRSIARVGVRDVRQLALNFPPLRFRVCDMVDVGASWCPVSSPRTRHHRATGVAGTRPRDDGDGVDDADARDAARALDDDARVRRGRGRARGARASGDGTIAGDRDATADDDRDGGTATVAGGRDRDSVVRRAPGEWIRLRARVFADGDAAGRAKF